MGHGVSGVSISFGGVGPGERALGRRTLDRSTLNTRQNRQIQREQRGRRVRGEQSFSNLDAVLGLNRQITGNQRVQDLGARAGQEDISLDQQGQDTLNQFFNPTLAAGQQQSIESLAKRASAQGLRGGAVSGQLGDLANRFIATNRANAFQGVQDIFRSRFAQIQEQTNPFLQQVGALGRNITDFSEQEGIGHVTAQQGFLASGGTTGEFTNFARPGLKALSALGLGGDALTAIARKQGVSFSGRGLTGESGIGDAFLQFLQPGTGPGRPVSHIPSHWVRPRGVGAHGYHARGSANNGVTSWVRAARTRSWPNAASSVSTNWQSYSCL